MLLLTGERLPSPLLLPFLSSLSPTLACPHLTAALVLAALFVGWFSLLIWQKPFRVCTSFSSAGLLSWRGTGQTLSQCQGRGKEHATGQDGAIPAAQAVTQKLIPRPLTALVLCRASLGIKRSLGAKYKKHWGLSCHSVVPGAKHRGVTSAVQYLRHKCVSRTLPGETYRKSALSLTLIPLKSKGKLFLSTD